MSTCNISGAAFTGIRRFSVMMRIQTRFFLVKANL
jgi:hypothetical protein